MLNYDEIYRENPDYFGKPFPELMDWFAEQKGRGKVLDVGCGQGRNAIPLAEMGYEVLGVDISVEGIEQLKRKMDDHRIQNLEVKAADFLEMDDLSSFSIFLLDGFFQFHEHDFERDQRVIHHLRKASAKAALFVFCFAEREDSVENFEELSTDFASVESKALLYTHRDPISEWEFETRYRLEILKKE